MTNSYATQTTGRYTENPLDLLSAYQDIHDEHSTIMILDEEISCTMSQPAWIPYL